jgi:hypothetical protein
MEFSSHEFRGTLLKILDVQIACHENSNGTYGQEYAYAMFPSTLRKMVLEACEKQHRIDPDDEHLLSNPKGWWKTISIRNCIFEDARSSESSQSTAPFSLRSIFAETGKGITATLQLGISLKAKMEKEDGQEDAPLPDSIPRRVEIEVYSCSRIRVGVDTAPVPFIRWVDTFASFPRPQDVVANPEFVRKFEALSGLQVI